WASYVSGGKEPVQMRDRLQETFSPGLMALLFGPAPIDEPVRLWWDSDAPELVELPWGLLTAPHHGQTNWFTFVRGLPPDPIPPLVPLEGSLRLALIGSGPGDTWRL